MLPPFRRRPPARRQGRRRSSCPPAPPPSSPPAWKHLAPPAPARRLRPAAGGRARRGRAPARWVVPGRWRALAFAARSSRARCELFASARPARGPPESAGDDCAGAGESLPSAAIRISVECATTGSSNKARSGARGRRPRRRPFRLLTQRSGSCVSESRLKRPGSRARGPRSNSRRMPRRCVPDRIAAWAFPLRRTARAQEALRGCPHCGAGVCSQSLPMRRRRRAVIADADAAIARPGVGCCRGEAASAGRRPAASRADAAPRHEPAPASGPSAAAPVAEARADRRLLTRDASDRRGLTIYAGERQVPCAARPFLPEGPVVFKTSSPCRA
jgi:hypothetical protein